MLDQLLETLRESIALKPQAPNLDGEGIPFIVLNRDGSDQVFPLEHLLPTPANYAGTAHLDDLDSFIAYVKERGHKASRIFATLSSAKFVAVLDFHTDIDPEWCKDIAEFNPKPKPEWTAWMARNKDQIKQAAFADFIEDNIQQIVKPDGAYLLEVCKSLIAKKSVDFKSGINLDNGDVQLQYEETTEAKAGSKGTLTIPTEISLALTPFEGAPAYEVVARLRYRIEEGKLYFTYKLRQPEKVWEDAVKDAVVRIGKESELPVFLGAYTRGK